MSHQRSVEYASDHHRPVYHFLPERNWMNDPNGLIQWKGQAHLFYQYNPNGPFHGTIHWGHAASPDLVHWEDFPIAIAPTPGGPDKDGCFSGCAVDNNGTPTLVYTGIDPQVVCLATSMDGLLTWQKHPANPVISAPPEEYQQTSGGHFRDPYVWKEGTTWYIVIGSKVKGVGGLVLLYCSPNLTDWQCLGPLLTGDVNQQEPIWTGEMWECPNFIADGHQSILLVSNQAPTGELLYTSYYTGNYQDHKFTPKSHGLLAYGRSFYAPQVMKLADGRNIVWGWLKEDRDRAACLEAGWSGVMSLPVEISAQPDNKLRIEPAVELAVLRSDHQHFGPLEMSPYPLDLLKGIRGSSLEILAEFETGTATEMEWMLFCSPDAQEQTRLVYQASKGRLIIDPSQSSLHLAVDRAPSQAPLVPDSNGHIQLHIFMDHSTLEVFANGSTYMAARVYPTRPDSNRIDLHLLNGKARLVSLDIWRLDSIW